MRFSLLYPVPVGPPDRHRPRTGPFGPEPRLHDSVLAELREQAVTADRTGWTSLMVTERCSEPEDHLDGYATTPNPLLVNVFLAQHTTRLRLGRMGLTPSRWNPVRLAEDIAVADHLTGGRLDVGLRRGHDARSGAQADDRRSFEEWFEVMRLSWSERPWPHDGGSGRLPPAGIAWRHPGSEWRGTGFDGGRLTPIGTVPKPLQMPHPPLFTMPTTDRADVEWAARVGGTALTFAADHDSIRRACDAYDQAAVRHGRDLLPGHRRRGAGIALCRFLAVAPTYEQARRAGEQAMPFVGARLGGFGGFGGCGATGGCGAFGGSGGPDGRRVPGGDDLGPRTLDRLIDTGAMLLGTPDDVGEQVARLGDEHGIDHVVLVACAGVTDHGRMLDTIGLIGEHVIPGLAVPAA